MDTEMEFKEIDTKIDIKEEIFWPTLSEETSVADYEVKNEEAVQMPAASISAGVFPHSEKSTVEPETTATGSPPIQCQQQSASERDSPTHQLHSAEETDSTQCQQQPLAKTHSPPTHQQHSASARDSHKDPTCRSSSMGLFERLISSNMPDIECSMLQAFRYSNENLISSLNTIADTMDEANKIRAQKLKLKKEKAKMKGIDIE